MARSTYDEIRSMNAEDIRNYLVELIKISHWKEIVRAYKLNPMAHRAIIHMTGDTALHMAVADWQEHLVEDLVELMSTEELAIKNKSGNTPLHIAASMGHTRICACIAKGRPDLVWVRNNDNETPLFSAALYGRKDAFLCLHYIYCSGAVNPYDHCRGKDGNTILHYAIHKDCFDLAYQIICLYGNLVNYVNELGVSPLHLLASKPSAFRSGCHLSPTDRIIYHCIVVDKLRKEEPAIIKAYREEMNPKYPENYQTCMNCIRLFTNLTGIVRVGQSRQKADPETNVALSPRTYQSSFPPNYHTCLEFVKLSFRAMVITVVKGVRGVRAIREMK
ncbi:serine/threonine-protein phosphatase 6 regulatory ankyrin repeat subunit B-like [Prunus dulcis]|uniref:serine/threonine-protein phosphatase 6 regulatory ankyrin repeat subunit B-like n=1 Tax=Prunus dulcis TaxID=3755 RepID=UPI0014824559|nr:serine/threonine-protein phosphatase 6 regulatory ankyrin repeat subunit B-like [Prunus dulcis]